MRSTTTPQSPAKLLRSPVDLDRAATCAACLLFLGTFVYLVYEGHGNSFFYDEWAWIQQRNSGLHWIVVSYNNHLVAAPVAVYQLLFRTVGLDHYSVYRVLETFVHLSCAAVVFVFARRRIGAAAVLLVLPIALLGSGWEYVLEPVNLGFVASIALSISALLALERHDRFGDALGCGLLVLALACSEFTVVFALGIAVDMVWRERALRRSFIWALPLALYAAWWLAFHEPSAARDNLTAAPAFALDLLASAVSGLFGLGEDWGRPLAVLGILIIGWRLTRPGAMTPMALILVVAAAGFWLLVALGRAQLGQPSAPRYVYTGAIFVALLLAESFRSVPMTPRVLGLGALVAVFAVAGNVRSLDEGENFLRSTSSRVAAELGALQLARAVAQPQLAVDARYAPVVFAGSYFAAIDAIGSSPGDPPGRMLKEPEDARTAADDLLVRAGELRVAVGATSQTLGRTSPKVDAVLAGTVSSDGPCVRFRSGGAGAALDLLMPPDGLAVSAAPGAPVAVRARRFASGFEGTPVTTVAGPGSIDLRPIGDRSAVPWHVRISPYQEVTACSLPELLHSRTSTRHARARRLSLPGGIRSRALLPSSRERDSPRLAACRKPADRGVGAAGRLAVAREQGLPSSPRAVQHSEGASAAPVPDAADRFAASRG